MYDVIIIGGGAAGMSCAMYCARFKLKTLVISPNIGGELLNIHGIENWPGEKFITGPELTKKMQEHAQSAGAEFKEETVIGIEKDKTFNVKTGANNYQAKAIVIATGSRRRELGVPGEKELRGKGVSYCAVCDGNFFKDKVVGVVGGSDAAAKEALVLSEHAKKVIILYRKQEIRAEPITKERIAKDKKIEIIPNVNVVKINGDKTVESVELDNGKTLNMDGVFIEIGGVPVTDLVVPIGVELNDSGEISVDKGMKTNTSGVFAAGDVTNGVFKQIITAASQGVTASLAAYKYVKTVK